RLERDACLDCIEDFRIQSCRISDRRLVRAGVRKDIVASVPIAAYCSTPKTLTSMPAPNAAPEASAGIGTPFGVWSALASCNLSQSRTFMHSQMVRLVALDQVLWLFLRRMNRVACPAGD